MALEFGAHYAGETVSRDVAKFAQRLEELGYDSFWSSEGALNRDCFPVLAAASAACNLNLGTGVVVMPFRDPTLTARTVATLDQLCGGKFIFGVGVGGERLREFAAYDVNPKQRGPRTNEALALMLRLWSETNVTFEGRFFRTQDSTLGVRPVQQPHPPILVGGRLGGQGKSRDAALRRTAAYGDGWLPYLVSADQYKAGLERLAEYAAAKGRSAGSFQHALQINIAIYPSQVEALEVLMAGSSRGYGLNQEQVERYYAFGSTQDVVDKLATYLEAGVESFVFQWACRREDVDSNVSVMAQEVMPELRRLAAH